MRTLEKLFAEKLLKVKAIKLQPSNPLHGHRDGNLRSIVTTVRLFHILLSVTL